MTDTVKVGQTWRSKTKDATSVSITETGEFWVFVRKENGLIMYIPTEVLLGSFVLVEDAP